MKYVKTRYKTWRENFEMRQIGFWLIGVCYFRWLGILFDIPMPALGAELVCYGMILSVFPAAADRLNRDWRLAGQDLPLVTFDELRTIMKDPAHAKDMWLGRGFPWGQSEAQRASDLLSRDWAKITREALGFMYIVRFMKKHWGKCLFRPLTAFHLYKEEQKRIAEQGARWIHGLGDEEKDVFQPLSHTEGHTLIVGTTGAGKTRCFDLLISQAILRNETIFIIDPKGDADLRDKAKRACEQLGRADKFMSFHPAFPQESIRINLLANWTRHSEIADRISSLLPAIKDSDPFKAFSFGALNAISYGLTMCAKRPSLKLLKHYLSGAGSGTGILARLVHDALENYFKEHSADAYAAYLQIPKHEAPTLKTMQAMVGVYADYGPQDPDMDDLINLFKHDQEHFSKMITSLLPILSMLTSGSLGDILSPADDGEVRMLEEVWFDTKTLIANNSVVYVGLDALSDPMVASAIGALFLSDLACTAGARYNFNDEENVKSPTLWQKITGQNKDAGGRRMVNIFVDESSEVVCPPFLQLLNKGRGAGMRMFVATQTVADFASRLGSKDKAVQFLGNLNNRICLRCVDLETQKYIADAIPKTKLAGIEKTQGLSTSAYEPVPKGGNVSERQVEKEAPLFAPEMLGMLPNLEYIAIVSGTQLIKGRYPLLVSG